MIIWAVWSPHSGIVATGPTPRCACHNAERYAAIEPMDLAPRRMPDHAHDFVLWAMTQRLSRRVSLHGIIGAPWVAVYRWRQLADPTELFLYYGG